MNTNNLPVILLKGLVLLPLEEARIEVNNEISKKILDISKLYHNNNILIVTPLSDLEENPDTTDLPRIGVIAKITSRIDLQNGNSRIVLTGEKRVKVLNYVNYSNESDILESIIAPIKEEEFNEVVETALLRKLMAELDRYISLNPYISNSIINQVKNITDLKILTDSISTFLPLNFEKKLSLMLECSRIKRAKKLITEINIELEILELENKIELSLKTNLDSMQKEMILKEKIKAIKEELGEKDSKTKYIDSIKEKSENLNLPVHIKERIKEELKRYEITPENSPEITVIRNYLDYLISIPFGITTDDVKDLNKIEETLNNSHYGLNEVKERILEYIAVLNRSIQSDSPIICLIGPPGVGKTTLAKSIATALNRKFVKISLGGLNDPAELIGHRKTYIGSSPGKIINALIKAKSENPIILLDEIDKLSKDYKGDPSSVLLDILDTNSNSAFIDSYIEEPINLSKVAWIITANDKSLIPPVLQDRLEIINLESYLDYEKLNIAKNYLIPTILTKYQIKTTDLLFTDKAIKKIINEYTMEAGVRELNRLIEKIIRKIIVENYNKNIKITIDNSSITKYLNIEKFKNNIRKKNIPGFGKCLAYTPLGGEVLEVEVTSYDGNDNLITSGSLGEVLKESIKVSISYIKANKEKFKINTKLLEKTIHINFREGATPKDGPSAGTLITSTILSYLTNISIPNNVSMTGEMTLLGDVLPIGGLREKSVAAIKEGINQIYISRENLRDINLLDKEIKNKIKFIPVNNYIEIYNSLFERKTNNDKRKTN